MKQVLILWEGANWAELHPLIDAGKMPNLEKLIKPKWLNDHRLQLKMPLKMALSVQIKQLRTSLAHGLQTNQCQLKVEKSLLTMSV